MLHFKFFLPRNGLVGVVDVTWTFFLDGFSAILDLNVVAIFAFFSLSSFQFIFYHLSPSLICLGVLLAIDKTG